MINPINSRFVCSIRICYSIYSNIYVTMLGYNSIYQATIRTDVYETPILYTYKINISHKCSRSSCSHQKPLGLYYIGTDTMVRSVYRR